MASGRLELHVAELEEGETESAENDIVAYLSLPAHPGRGTRGVVAKQVRLRDIVEDRGSVDVYLDFDHDGQLIGLEILD